MARQPEKVLDYASRKTPPRKLPPAIRRPGPLFGCFMFALLAGIFLVMAMLLVYAM